MKGTMSTTAQRKKTKLQTIRENEGWALNELATASDLATPTYKKAEQGRMVRPFVWGKILKGINKMPNKTREYAMTDIRESV